MFCPRCGRQPISDSLRFCSYCGLKLGVVKASLAEEEDVTSCDSFTIQVLNKEPRQRDINIGVLLMFVGSLLATVLASRGLGREGGALILAVSFASIVLLSRPLMKTVYKLLSWEEPPDGSISVNQRGMLFGSIVMFTSTIVLAVCSLLMFGRMRTPELVFALMGALVVFLFTSKYLMRAVRYLVAAETIVPETQSAVVDAGSVPGLTARQNVPASLFTAQRVTTAELTSPVSITEHTTNLLEKETASDH